MPNLTSYTVRAGDTLSGIALARLGCVHKWQEIYDLNREVIGRDPDILKPGMVLRLLQPPQREATMQRKDVERLAARLDTLTPKYGNRDDAESAAALRALLDRAESAEAERDAAFAAGQESMRERAADAALYLCRMKGMGNRTIDGPEAAHLIRALPLKGETR